MPALPASAAAASNNYTDPTRIVMASRSEAGFAAGVELAGLDPATSWVRSNATVTLNTGRLQDFLGEHLECRNISRNSLHHDLQDSRLTAELRARLRVLRGQSTVTRGWRPSRAT
jgi:hypothetical protein